jgi:hypothetical protein
MKLFIVIIEILREASRWKVLDLLVENIGNRKAMLFKDIEEKDQLIFSLLPVVNVLLKLEQKFPDFCVFLLELIYSGFLVVINFRVDDAGPITQAISNIIRQLLASHGGFE